MCAVLWCCSVLCYGKVQSATLCSAIVQLCRGSSSSSNDNEDHKNRFKGLWREKGLKKERKEK